VNFVARCQLAVPENAQALGWATIAEGEDKLALLESTLRKRPIADTMIEIRCILSQTSVRASAFAKLAAS